MLDPSATSGLCGTCEYGGSCVYRTGSSHAVLDCGEFQTGMPEQGTRQRSTPDTAASPAATESHQAAEYLGLCSNCENRERCTLPRPEGGVWFCQEYA